MIISGTSPHMQTLVFLPLRGAVLHMREIVIIRVYFLSPPLLFYFLGTCRDWHRLTDFRVLWLKRRVSATTTSFFGCEQKILIFSTIFRKNTQNSLFPQCKSLIGNNSGSIKDRDVTFAYNRGFSATADRIDRHLCHVTESDHTNRFIVKQHLECV